MIDRCTDDNDAAFANYGGRGITVCERWQSFENFLSDMGERPTGMTLDRIDNELGYSPENCRWATRTQQNRNTRAVKLSPDAARAIRQSDERRSVLAARYGVSVATIKAVRAGRNWRDV